MTLASGNVMKHDITSEQLRAARALANWSRKDLAEEAETTERTIARLEDGDSAPRASTSAAIRKALEAAGVVFVGDGERSDGGGPGVRLAPPPPRASDYLLRIPKPGDVPAGRVVVHNDVQPTRRLGSRGFRAWLATEPPEAGERCACGWAPELGRHYSTRSPFRDANTKPLKRPAKRKRP
jgi:transcriptional regulator with XRE-family HTH domain